MDIRKQLAANGGSLSKKTSFKTAQTLNKGDQVIDFAAKDSYIPKPLTFKIVNNTGATKRYNLGLSSSLATNHDEELVAPTSIDGGKYTLADLRADMGDESRVIAMISYRTSSDTSQFDEVLEYRHGVPNNFGSEDLTNEVSEAQTPEANNDKYLKIVPRGRTFFYNKKTLWTLSVINGQTVTVRFTFAGVEGTVVAQ